MSDTTPRLGLPLIAAGQAEKELFHNEALARIDALVLATIENAGLDAPPADAAPGRAWIVGAAPTGDWAGQAGALACRTEGGWRFVAPVAGMAVRRADDGIEWRFDGTRWSAGMLVGDRVILGGIGVVGMQQPPIAAPSGGAVVDTQARDAIAAMLAALTTHGLIAP